MEFPKGSSETQDPALEIYHGEMGKGWGSRAEKGRKPSKCVQEGRPSYKVI